MIAAFTMSPVASGARDCRAFQSKDLEMAAPNE
jgi:hypothetical protein